MDDLHKPDVDVLAAMIPDGASIAICKNASGVASELVRALVRRGARELHVISVPTNGYATDVLIGAGCVKTVETSAVTLDETGLAPRFVHAVKSGSIKILDSTCPAVYSGLRAGEKGIPFIPIRGLIGTDIMRYRDDYKVIDNPYAEADPIVLIPAIVPDFALIHAAMADDDGNIYIGRDRDLALMAHAAKQTLVTVEKRYSGNLMNNPRLAAATVSSIYVGGIAVAEQGGWPLALQDHYPEDQPHMARYQEMASADDSFRAYLEEFVTPDRTAA